MRVVVTGGTGFLGRALVGALAGRGAEAVVVTRDPSRAGFPPGARGIGWDGLATALDGADAVVNLAGETIAQRWTTAAKSRIVGSRAQAAERVGAALRAAKSPPAVLVNASAVGFYGSRGDEELTEESPSGSGFLAETTLAWERAAREAVPDDVRLVLLRTGVVLDAAEGALARMLLPFRLGLGGPLGSGRQWMPWIHRDDLVALLLAALDDARYEGPVNGTAPGPVPMRVFAAALGRVLRRPAFAPAPAFAIRAAMGEMAALVLDGQRALPAKALALGFRFRFPDLEQALRDLLAPDRG
ncbi:MAG TPA: TIGR01777 family oxidoreductase [Thermoanaerobaculia bacterium]|nr:TIGR01777 family oxidoreductase [Thermoanaerobaculia bacterium]HQP88493.1 TIGR01777 family oxidoreductase [Thermoanaerobaculia bacterium]